MKHEIPSPGESLLALAASKAHSLSTGRWGLTTLEGKVMTNLKYQQLKAYALYHHMRLFHHVATTTRCNIVFPDLHTPHYVSKTPPSSLSKSSGPAVEASVIAFCGEGSSPSSFCSHLQE